MHRAWTLGLVGSKAYVRGDRAELGAVTARRLVRQLLDADGPLAPRLGPDEVRAWVACERFQPDAWMLDRGDLLGAR